MKMQFKTSITRRRFLAFAGLGISAAGLLGVRHRWRTIGTLRHEPGMVDTNELDTAVSASLVAFLGALFGVPLTAADITELKQRLQYAATRDSNWHEEYAWLARFVDNESRKLGAASLAVAERDMQESVIRSMFADLANWRGQRIRAFFSLDGRRYLRMQRSTVPHLNRLYRHSGVPWRHRGYRSWPGVAGDMLAYTRRAESSRC